MIVFEKHDDIVCSELQTLVCPVNTKGVMGAGLAAYFKSKFPALLVDYRRACLNDVLVSKGYSVHNVNSRKILCLPTKREWWDPSKLEYIEFSLEAIAKTYQEHEITSLAMPAIGCGRGGLEWSDVKPLIYKYLDPLELPVGIYLP